MKEIQFSTCQKQVIRKMSYKSNGIKISYETPKPKQRENSQPIPESP